MSSNKIIKQVLTEARKLVKRGWCQGMFAQNADGDQVDYQNEGAVKFCMLGAISRCANFDWQDDETPKLVVDIKQCVKDVLPNKSFAFDNDAPDTKQADVLGWFDAAIASCKD